MQRDRHAPRSAAYMTEELIRLPMHVGPHPCPAKKPSRRLGIGDRIFIEGGHGAAVQWMDGHFGSSTTDKLGQSADVIYVSVRNKDPSDIAQRKRLAEFTAYRIDPPKNLLKRFADPLPVSTSVIGPAPSSRHTCPLRLGGASHTIR